MVAGVADDPPSELLVELPLSDEGALLESVDAAAVVVEDLPRLSFL